MNSNQQYLVSPRPPMYRDELTHIGAGLRFSQSPTNFLAELRGTYGDTFLVDVFGYKLFCVFSPAGLKSLYSAAEDEASFGMATFDMLGFKTPIEVFMDADIDLFYELLTPEKVSAYIPLFNEAIVGIIAAWGDAGSINVFDEIRTMQQRVGFNVWLGAEATGNGVWPRLKQHFDVLSQENAFVSPQNTLETLTSGKAKEKQAIAEIMSIIGDTLLTRESSGSWPDDNLTFLYQRFGSDDPQVTLRKVTHNAINANQGFLSNLYAALAWSLINVKRYPETEQRLIEEITATKARFGTDFCQSQQALDSMFFCEQLLMESVRLAQRSITLRKVMKEMDFDAGDQIYTLQPGVYVTTMLSVGNTQTAELASFDPDHYKGRKLDPALVASGRETVSTFGHGKHACPAQKFSHNMCKILLSNMLENFEFSALPEKIEPSSSQMGGVARASEDVILRFSRKSQAQE